MNYHKEAFRQELEQPSASRRIAKDHWAKRTEGYLFDALRHALCEMEERGKEEENAKALRGILANLN